MLNCPLSFFKGEAHRFFKLHGGECGIRTHGGRLDLTRFPSEPIRPLWQLSLVIGPRGDQVICGTQRNPLRAAASRP